jgi:hypothetical protein
MTVRRIRQIRAFGINIPTRVYKSNEGPVNKIHGKDEQPLQACQAVQEGRYA